MALVKLQRFAQLTLLVTRNPDLLDVGAYQGVRMVTSEGFLRRLKKVREDERRSDG